MGPKFLMGLWWNFSSCSFPFAPSLQGILKLFQICQLGQSSLFTCSLESILMHLLTVFLQKSSVIMSFLKTGFFLKLCHCPWVCVSRAVATSPGMLRHWSCLLILGMLRTITCPPQEQSLERPGIGHSRPQWGAKAVTRLWRRGHTPWQATPSPAVLVLRVVGEGCRRSSPE